MNIVFSLIVLASSIMILLNSPDSLISSMMNGTSSAITLSLKLLSIYAIWMSILDIMEKIGVDKIIAKVLSPISRKLFKNEEKRTHELIAMNFATNLLGMGGAATPLGIEAIERMNREKSEATDNSILFTVINATSISLIPSTIIGLRASYGASSPSDIILPSLIASTIATLVGVILSKILSSHG